MKNWCLIYIAHLQIWKSFRLLDKILQMVLNKFSFSFKIDLFGPIIFTYCKIIEKTCNNSRCLIRRWAHAHLLVLSHITHHVALKCSVLYIVPTFRYSWYRHKPNIMLLGNTAAPTSVCLISSYLSSWQTGITTVYTPQQHPSSWFIILHSFTIYAIIRTEMQSQNNHTQGKINLFFRFRSALSPTSKASRGVYWNQA